MQDFSFFFQQGLSHISDPNAYDHILFIVALAALHSLSNWRSLLYLVTAFTIGHSLALALATFRVVQTNIALVEFLIPLSIIGTCIWNVFRVVQATQQGTVDEEEEHILDDELTKPMKLLAVRRSSLIYTIVIAFGLIHGLGFSNYLRFLLSEGESIFVPLLGFNVGLELGQILILIVALLINFVFLDLARISFRIWAVLVSFLVFCLSVPLAIETGTALFASGG
jgi:hypothetical protein